MFRISLCASILPAAVNARLASVCSSAVSCAARAAASKKPTVPETEMESDDFTDDDFAWLDEFFDEGFGDSIDFIPEDEAKFLAAETKPRTP